MVECNSIECNSIEHNSIDTSDLNNQQFRLIILLQRLKKEN